MKIRSEPRIILDEVDKRILNILNQNARISLTDLARKINFSVDGIRKRMLKFEKNGVIYRYIAIPNYNLLNFPISATVLIKTKSVDEGRLAEFVMYLKKHKRITYLLTLTGDSDFSVTVIARDMQDFETFSKETRTKFPDVIDKWNPNIIAKDLKIEELKL